MIFQEVKKVKFYYYKTPIVNNIFTVCTFFGNNKEILSRGIAICSLLDNFEKSKGRKISYSRAMKALYNEADLFPIYTESNWHKSITRKLKLKTDKDRENFECVIIPILKKYAIKYKKFTNDKEKVDKIVYWFNKDYPMIIANKFFNFKSEFKPTETLFMTERK
jgi:hypothetical protein